MTEQWMTVRQACERLDCHESTLRIYIRKGLVRKWQAVPSQGMKRGSKPWIYAYDVEALMPRLPLPVGRKKGKEKVA
jgi:hypothetical protein